MNQHGESLRTIQEESTDGSKYTTRAEVFTRNPNYAFVLQRKSPAADAASPWLISELSKVNAGAPWARDKEFQAFQAAIAAPAVTLRRQPLADFINEANYREIRCRYSSEASADQLVEVSFALPRDPTHAPASVVSGTLLLNPKHLWCLCRSEVQWAIPDRTGTTSFEVLDWGETSEGLVFPRRTRELITAIFKDGSKAQRESNVTWDIREPKNLPPDRELSLAAFGLPEPPGSDWPQNGPSAYIWVAVVGLICLAAATVLRRVYRHARS
jgi:hypothetical protein